jgi:CBS domain-containing protein
MEGIVADQDVVVTVDQIMRRFVPTVDPDDSIEKVARTLVGHNVAGVPVVSDGVMHGIVTESDLVFREAEVSIPGVATFLDAVLIGDAGTPFEEDLRRVLSATARELMTAPVYSIRQGATLQDVATLMTEYNISTVPVVDNENNLVGIVSRSDLVRLIARLEAASDNT